MSGYDVFNREEEKKKQEALENRRRERDRSDLCKVLKSPEGRRLLWAIMEDSRVFRTTYSGNPYDTAFREGKRAIGVAMLGRIMDADPGAFPLMQREAETDNVAAAQTKKGEENG